MLGKFGSRPNGRRSAGQVPGTVWPEVLRDGAGHVLGFLIDGSVWLAGILVLSAANFALGFLRLPPRQLELMEAIHLNTLYATLLVVSAGAVSRLLVATLDRLGAIREE